MAQSNRLIYDEPVDIESIAKRIADLNQQYTQYAGVRPFGVSLIISGVDENNGPVVFLTDPTGAYLGFDAIAIGAGSDQVNDYLEKNYSKDASLDQAVTLAIECIYLVSEDKLGVAHIKTAVIDSDNKKMRRLTEQEIAKNAATARTRSEKSPPKSG
jgi:proteasome alpha subunit